MELIRCTGKLQKEMGLKPKDLETRESDNACLGQWHANLIYIDRRKTLLFVNDRTRFNFIVPDVPQARIRQLDDLFRFMLSCVLADEQVPDATREKILDEYSEIGFAKSSNRSVLGSINDLAFHYELHILREGGIHTPLVPQIIRNQNRLPMKAIEYGFPIEKLADLYGFKPLRDKRLGFLEG
ncbi:MAG: DUF6933 domain-containing protein [Candidatus Sumerlaeota bacterium]